MNTQIMMQTDKVAAFSQKWGICEFALFGSMTRGDFTDESDIDVLVQFREDVRPTLFDMVNMTDELETIFGRKVDLLTRKSVEKSRNYIRRKAILNSTQVIYAE